MQVVPLIFLKERALQVEHSVVEVPLQVRQMELHAEQTALGVAGSKNLYLQIQFPFNIYLLSTELH